MKPIPIFIGYDPREAVAYHTCANSIIRHASQPVAIIPLALNFSALSVVITYLLLLFVVDPIFWTGGEGQLKLPI